MTAGFLVIDKTGGISSNEVVIRVRRATGVRKAGHAGTLDPMATGVVVVALGPVTRLIRFIQDQPKEYLATAQFGVSTDTLDADGAILSREEMWFGETELRRVAGRFIGVVSQVPPMVSALKHEGRRLYQLAREGQTVEREARAVEIHELEVLSVGPGPYPEVDFRVVCGKGTYVRSLAADMAAALGGTAHLTSLRRTRVGGLTADEHGLGLERLDEWEAHLIDPVIALADLAVVEVGAEAASAVCNGMRFVGGELGDGPEGQPFQVVDRGGGLLGVYRRDGDVARPLVVLPG